MAGKVTYKNILSFLQGNSRYYISKYFGIPEHRQEQVNWRLSKCKDDCLKTGKCIICGCPPDKKAFVDESCNPNRHPDLMNAEEWAEYKKEHNIKI